MELVNPKVETYCHEQTQAEPELLQALAEDTRAHMPMAQMLTGRLEGRFLKLLVQLTGARRILEIGMYTGYSALSMAEALPEDGELITCDIDPAAEAFARRYFAQSPHGHKIRVAMGAALDTIAGLSGEFDLVFLDADKESYPAYYEAVLPLLRRGGLLVVDNSLWSGKVLKPEDEASLAIAELNTRIAADPRVENVLLTVRDGVNLVRKR
ncbi:MAG: class I SAM-dependent methyltransferase [Gammaproteobacteria bacterium]|nr:class I SAM-dependent methyltransferase [Gammaproteobacteria bacterium]